MALTRLALARLVMRECRIQGNQSQTIVLLVVKRGRITDKKDFASLWFIFWYRGLVERFRMTPTSSGRVLILRRKYLRVFEDLIRVYSETFRTPRKEEGKVCQLCRFTLPPPFDSCDMCGVAEHKCSVCGNVDQCDSCAY